MTLIYHEPSTRDDESTREREKERKRNQSSGATGTEEAKTMKKERALRKQSEKRRGVVESAVLECTGGWGYWGCCGSADASSMASSGGYPSFLALPGYWTRATYSVRRQNTETEPHREEKAREAARVDDQKSEKT
jgi:hypothetical protein